MSPLHCVSLYTHASSSCYTVPLFLPTAIFIVIFFFNPYTLAASALSFHTPELAEMPHFSTASTVDKTGEHTPYTAEGTSQTLRREAVTGYCLAVVVTHQARKILPLQLSPDCTATLTHLEGLDSSIT